MTGPLASLRVVEFEGIGPGPLAGMLFADWGADVVVVSHPAEMSGVVPARYQLTRRGKRIIAADLKTPTGRGTVLGLLEHAHVLLEGFRPGTMERLGLGPETVARNNPRLVYTRITGWGQTGPRARTAGHDIAYLAVTGALAAIGRAGQAPLPPINFLGDYAGGTMFAVAGTLAALWEAERSGRGQVVDAAMVDGVGALMAPLVGMVGAGFWALERGTNLLDTGAPFYDVYQTKDGRYLAVGSLEDRFFAALLKGLELDPAVGEDRWNRERWPALRQRIALAVAGRTRDEWDQVFQQTDACVAPVLDVHEAAVDPGNRARNAFEETDGVLQPAKAPRFGRSRLAPNEPPTEALTPAESILNAWRGAGA